MSSEPPPNPITSTFNLRAWIQATSTGLSLATANTLYLSKKIADTCVGLITFTNGILVFTIDALTPTSSLSLASLQTTGNIFIGNGLTRTGAILIGARAIFPSANTILIGNATTAFNYLRGIVIYIGDNASCTNVNIGKSGTETFIYGPNLADAVYAPDDNSTKIASTNWVWNFINYLATYQSIGWFLSQTFNGGLLTTSIKPIVSTGNIDIATTMDSGTNIISIGTAGLGKTTVNSTNIYLQESGNGTINLGNTSGTGALNIYKSIAPQYTYPVGAGNIGYQESGTYSATGTFSSGTAKAYSIITIPAGLYSLNATASIYWRTGGVLQRVRYYIQSAGGATYAMTEIGNQTGFTDFQRITLSPSTILQSGGTSYTLYIDTNFTGTAPERDSTNFSFKATRLA